MTIPGMSSHGLPPNWDALPRRIKQIERRLDLLATARTLENASIGEGGELVIEPGATIHVADGGTVQATNDAGTTVALHQLAFGATGTTDLTELTPAVNDWDLESGPSVTVNIQSGRCLVVVTCRMLVGSSGEATPCQGSMSYSIDGPAGVVGPDRARGLRWEYNGNGQHTLGQASFMLAHTGLGEPGVYTFSSCYMADCVGTPTNETTFSNRSIAVIPF